MSDLGVLDPNDPEDGRDYSDDEIWPTDEVIEVADEWLNPIEGDSDE